MKAAESFLAKRVGEGAGTVVSAKGGNVKVAPVDERVVLGAQLCYGQGDNVARDERPGKQALGRCGMPNQGPGHQ